MKRTNINFCLNPAIVFSVWNNFYNRKFISLFLFCVLCTGSIHSQPKIDLLGFAKGDSVILISGIAPQSDEGINFYRKNSSGQFVLLNTEGPVNPITNAEEIKKYLVTTGPMLFQLFR